VTSLFGHDPEIAAFIDAAQAGKMHHAWLLTGQKGIGKASFAKAAARYLLAIQSANPPSIESFAVTDNHSTAQLMKARSHPDYVLIEREVWEKGSNKDRLVPYADRKPEDVAARSIRVIQIRWLMPILSKSPSLSARRVVVIDAADDLERGAANALLKSLEEPPAGTIFLLVSHAAGRLLPTIRSRCRTLRFSGLDDAAMTSVVRSHLPDASFEEVEALVRAGEGSPGRALGFAGLDIASIDASLIDLANSGDPSNAKRAALAQKLSTKSAQLRYEAFLTRAPAFIAAAARQRSRDELAVAIREWEAAKSLANSAIATSLDPQSVVFTLAGHVAALAPGASSAKA
jgi:DNA polymerase III subunit delta'